MIGLKHMIACLRADSRINSGLHDADAMMPETETALRKNLGTAREGCLQNSLSSTMACLTAEGQQQQQQLPRVMQQQERFPAHEMCWQGRVEELMHLLHLDDPDYKGNPCHLEQALLQRGTVPVCLNFLGHSGSHKHCPKEEGTLAVLAVKKRRFECANMLLSVLLFKQIQRATWCDEGFPKWAEPSSWHLCRLLRYMGLKHCDEFASLLLEARDPECTALLTLVAACVLGDEELATTIVAIQDQTYWTRVNRTVQLLTISACSRFGEMFVETTAMVGACIGGKATCVALVKKTFPSSENVLAHKCCHILRKGVWSWEPEQIVKSLKHCPKRLMGLDDLNFFLNSTGMVVNVQGRSKAELCQNFASDLLEVVWAACKMTPVDDISPSTILGVLSKIISWFSSIDPKSKAAELLNGLASLALYWQASVNGILCGNFSEEVVAMCKAEKWEAVLDTLFQFWVATKSLYKGQSRTCIFCRQPNFFIWRELALRRGVNAVETLAQYFRSEDIDEVIELSFKGFSPWTLNFEICRVCRNQASQYSRNVNPKPILKSFVKPKMRSLTQLSKLALLERMDKERKLFHEFQLPGGLSKLFMVHNFLEEWGCALEAKE